VQADTLTVQAVRAARLQHGKALEAFERREIEPTLEALDAALRLWPDYPDAHFLRAKVAYHQKNYAQAAQHMARAEQALLAAAALQGDAERARKEELQKYLDSERVRTDQMRSAQAQATSDGQRQELQERIDTAERDRGDLQRELGELPGVGASGLPPDYDFFGGNILLRLGQREEAAERYRRAIAAKPDHAEAINNLASLYLDAGQPLLARAVLLQAEAKGVKVNGALKQAVLQAVGP
jgi:tetratricopeptide (TPR) repeat protein